MKRFELIDEDYYAIEIAIKSIRSHIEDSIEEYLNLGAEIYVDDSSEIEYE